MSLAYLIMPKRKKMLNTQYEIDKYTVQKKDYNIYKCRGGRVLKNKNKMSVDKCFKTFKQSHFEWK